MIGVRLRGSDLGRVRFAQSPLVEVMESLWMLSSGQLHPVHRPWLDETRCQLRRIDFGLLSAVVPARPVLAEFLLPGASDPATSIQDQLAFIEDLPPDVLRREIEDIWHGDPLPPKARELLSDGAAGPRRLAEALWQYWVVAIEPYWPRLCAIYEDDVAYRAATLTKDGVGALLSDLHPEISVGDDVVWIKKSRQRRQTLPDGGLLLVPSAFAWPNLIFESGRAGTASLTYAVRGVANVWSDHEPAVAEDSALGALIGRTRAAILMTLVVPHSTTELALELGVSPPSVSQHLSVLRSSGLVVSWRRGRSVMYRRTALATSIIEAGSMPLMADEAG